MKWPILILLTSLAFGQTIKPSAIQTKSLNNTKYVGPTITGVDIGADINAAYAACSSTGCKIHISATSSCYNFTTPIVFSTVDKPALIEGDPGGATCIKYTPITGTAITLDYGVHEKPSQGVRDLQIIGPGPGTSTVGIQVGAANGAEGSVIRGVKFGTNCCSSDGFGKAIAYNANGAGFLSTIQDSFIEGSGTGIDIPGNVENIRLVNNMIGRNATGINIAANVADIYVYGTSFDDNTTVAVSVVGGLTNPEPVFTCIACHFENLSLGTGQYITASNASVFLYGGAIYDDRTVGTNPQFISASGVSYVTALGTSLNSGGITVTQAVTFAGTSRGFLNFINTTTTVAADYNTAYTGGPAISFPLRGTSLTPLSVSSTGWLASAAVPFIFSPGAGLNNYSLVTTNPSASRTITFNDPTGNALLGSSFNTSTGVYQAKKNVAGCTTAASIGGVCASPITVTWTTAFADTNYSATCTPSGAPTNLPASPYISAKANGTITVNYFAITAAAASWATIDCIAVHD